MNNRTKFKVDIHNTGMCTDEVLKLIGCHNSGKSYLSIPDFISYGVITAALYPATRGGITIDRDDEESRIFYVSEDGGKTKTLTIEEIEVFELVESSDPDDIKDVL